LASHDIKKIPAKDDRNLAVREWIQDTDAVTVIYVHGKGRLIKMKKTVA
jgi:hypothetical protein